MENKEFAKKLEERTKNFAISIIKLSATLTDTIEGMVIRNQITKSGTSIRQITVKPTDQEVKWILGIRQQSVKVNQVKQDFGLK